MEHFNRLEFWEAHDSWEKVWLVAQGDEKRFAQGLIQLAAAYLHVRRGTGRPAARLFASGLEKLSVFDPAYAGVDRRALMDAAARHLEWLRREGGGALPDAEFPRLGIADAQP